MLAKLLYFAAGVFLGIGFMCLFQINRSDD